MQPVRFVKSSGVHVAYQVTGTGAHDILFLPGAWGQLEVRWEEPSYARLLSRLAAIGRLIQFDRRGTGLSDRGLATGVDDHLADLLAVVDAVGARRPVIFASFDGAAVALLHAARSPERVEALVLFAGFARALSDDPDAPGIVLDPRLLIRRTDEDWGDPWLLDIAAPSRSGDAAFAAWWGRYQRASISPAAAAAMIASIGDIDVRDVLPDVRAPVLILHRAGDRLVPVANAQYLGRALPDAHVVELPGNDYMLCAGDVDAVVDEIERFLHVPASRSTRPRVPDGTLTRREFEIAELVGKGRTNAQIAAQLVISERTVESHVSAVLRKLQMSSRSMIAAWVARARDR